MPSRLHDKNKKRKAYYELYTGINWGMTENYDKYLFQVGQQNI